MVDLPLNLITTFVEDALSGGSQWEHPKYKSHALTKESWHTPLGLLISGKMLLPLIREQREKKGIVEVGQIISAGLGLSGKRLGYTLEELDDNGRTLRDPHFGIIEEDEGGMKIIDVEGRDLLREVAQSLGIVDKLRESGKGKEGEVLSRIEKG